MNKTPVSFLQEIMIKKKCVPHYELIPDSGGAFEITFQYQVSCDGLVAQGPVRSKNKKDAKHEAAKAMLEKIAASNPDELSATIPATISVPSRKRALSTDDTVSPEKARDTSFFNAVGALAELCIKHKLQVPDYKEVDYVGPDHARTFTIRCMVSTFKEEGVATTKKQAKHEAAKKMLEKIQVQGIATTKEMTFLGNLVVTPQSIGNQILAMIKKQENGEPEKKTTENIQVPGITTTKKQASPQNVGDQIFAMIKKQENGEPEKKTTENIRVPGITTTKKQASPQAPLKKMAKTEVIEDSAKSDEVDMQSKKAKLKESLANELAVDNILAIKQENAHKYVKRNYDENTRCEYLEKLNKLIEMINTADSEVTEEFVDALRQKVVTFLKPLNMTYSCKKLESKSPTKTLVLVEISTNPDIAEVGIAVFAHHAEMNGMKKVLKTLINFL